MMLTRCPYCGTTFRVTPDQLKVRQGQVRCGQCRRVFDALRGLAENAAKPAPAPHQPEPIRNTGLSWSFVQPAPPGTDASSHEPVTISGFDFVPTREPEPVPEPAAEAPTGFDPVTEAAPEAGFERIAAAAPKSPVEPEPPVEEIAFDGPIEEITIEAPPEPFDEPEPAIEWDDSRGPETQPQPEPQPEPQMEQGIRPEPAPEARLEPDPEPRFEPFLFDAGPPTILELHDEAPPTGRSWPWVLASLLGLVLLAGQMLLHFRTDLIAASPGARPAFATACELLGCRIELPHKIDLIGIESSDLAPDQQQPGTLHLATTLRNRAPYAQNWPHLEITLTDAQERPLLRRSLAPAEYLSAQSPLADGFPPRSEQPVQLTLTAADVPAVGYRLYVFYP
jgi:predicted Zn finger-like uncharacterized protein